MGDTSFESLYAEINALKTQVSQLERQLQSKSLQVDNYEVEIRTLRSELAEKTEELRRAQNQDGLGQLPSRAGSSGKELPKLSRGDTKLELSSELEELRSRDKKRDRQVEDLTKRWEKVNEQLDSSKGQIVLLEHEVERLRLEKQELQKSAVEMIQASAAATSAAGGHGGHGGAHGGAGGGGGGGASGGGLLATEDEGGAGGDQMMVKKLQAQIFNMANGAARKHNELQNQLQGFESFVEELKYQYEEFLEVTKLEHESFKSLHMQEFERLKLELEQLKQHHFEEKRKLTREHQGLLYAMQAQFDEYRTTVEFLYNTESAKFEDRISTQQQKYEQELRYIVQAKDKFYEDMMVAKDAKIMSLIEGSDLQSILQKHELEMEHAQKLHAKELERLRHHQESEQKRMIAQLQRENAALDQKFDKSQSHVRSLEQRIKEHMGVIEQKNRYISEKEAQQLRDEAEWQRQLDNAQSRMQILSQEKEHLRHRIVRMQLDAKGEGDNSLDSLVKRLSRDTGNMASKYGDMLDRYEKAAQDNLTFQRRLKEREGQVAALQRGIARRNEELEKVTSTFEAFLLRRARELERQRVAQKRARGSKAGSRGGSGGGATPAGGSAGAGAGAAAGAGIGGIGAALGGGPAASTTKRGGPSPLGSQGSLDADSLAKVKVAVPRIFNEAAAEESTRRLATQNQGPSELERGFAYLTRFKALSLAFSTGNFHQPAGQQPYKGSQDALKNNALISRLPLYDKLASAEETHSKLKYETSKRNTLNELEYPKPAVYQPQGTAAPDAEGADAHVKVYVPSDVELDRPIDSMQGETLALGTRT